MPGICREPKRQCGRGSERSRADTATQGHGYRALTTLALCRGKGAVLQAREWLRLIPGPSKHRATSRGERQAAAFRLHAVREESPPPADLRECPRTWGRVREKP